MNNQMMKGSASDYIKVKKQNTIYTGIKVNAQLTGDTVNPVKKNGYYYNNMLNVNVPTVCNFSGCKGGILTNARSYQLRLDFKQGKQYNQYVCNCQNVPINDILDFNSCDIVEMPSTDVVTCPCTACAFN
jgi:hypothetical protein